MHYVGNYIKKNKVWRWFVVIFVTVKCMNDRIKCDRGIQLSGLNQTDRPLFKLHCGRHTRGRSLKLAKHRCSKEERRVSFTQRVMTTWNKLPEHIVRAPTVNAFKIRFDKHLENRPSVLDADCY